MTENLKKFLETVSKSDELTARIGSMGKRSLSPWRRNWALN